MRDLTVDVGVLMSGSALGDGHHYEASNRLMRTMEEVDEARLVLDDRGIIAAQYDQMMVQGTVGREWIRQMASRGKTQHVRWKQIDRGTKAALAEAHFDWEDFKYVRTAAESQNKHLVSHDPDYSPAVRKILVKRLSVIVLEANAATHFITG